MISWKLEKGGGGMVEGGGVQAGNEREEWQYKRLERVLELVSYLLQCNLV